MEKISKMFISMVYPFLISLFIFCFVDAFVKTYSEELELFTSILMIVFGTLFIVGIILNIVWNVKNKKIESK